MEVEITPPEAYRIIEALDIVQANSTNQRTVCLAFLVQITSEVPGWIAARYDVQPGPTVDLDAEEELPLSDSSTNQFWIGTVTPYRGLREAVNEIAKRGPQTEQRALLNLVIRLVPELKTYRDSIDGIITWRIVGRK
jgi:hypothetical protein